MAAESLRSAAEAGDRLATLRALRDGLAADLEMCESMRDKAALGRLFADVLGQIAEVEKSQPAQKGTALDELKQRRAQRQAPRSSGASKRNQRG